MKSFLLILSSSVILLFSGCYTQLLTEEDSPTIAETTEVGDTLTSIYFPQDTFIPIDGVVPESENPLVSTSGEIEQQPQATDEWLVNPLPFGQKSEGVHEHTNYTIGIEPAILLEPILHTEPIQDNGVSTGPVKAWHRTIGDARDDYQNSVLNSTQTATSTTPVTVHRTSGVERTAVQNPVTTSSQDDTRNSGTTRRGRR